MKGMKPHKSSSTPTASNSSRTRQSRSAFTTSAGDPPPNSSSTSYLEKDAALQKINAELERKSADIMKRLEQYSNRGRSLLDLESGDAPLLLPHREHEEDPSSYSKGVSPDPQEEEDIWSRPPSALSLSLCKRPPTPTHTADTKEVDLKARKRLQRATESVVKCLQSKLISHETRLTDLHLQFRQKIQENTMLEGKIRALEDDRERMLKNMANLQTAAEKSAKAAEVAKSSLSSKGQSCAVLKRELDTLRRDGKGKAALVQNLQTRLNRSLEEIDRLKQANRGLHQTIRDKQTEDRAAIDELQQKIAQLEQQKSILNATIGKQAGLIKTLRQQKT